MKLLGTAVVAAATGMLLPEVRATSRFYTPGVSGNWNVASNWNTMEAGGGSSGSPVSGDQAYIRGGSGRIVTYNFTYPGNFPLASLTVDSTGGTFTSTFSQTISTTTMTVTSAFIGDSGNGAYEQSAGLTAPATLTLGNASGSGGRYTLSAAGTLKVTGSAYVGASGAATFSQSGGTHTINGVASTQTLYVGYNATGNGLYDLSGGTLDSNRTIVGYSGAGSFTQSGGSHLVDVFSEFDLGYNAGSTGTYVLSGSGTLTANSTEYIARSGNATFTQSGGTHHASGPVRGIDLAYAAGTVGQYNLSGGSLFTTTWSVGYNGAGVFNQTGGSCNAGPGSGSSLGLVLGENSGSSGIVNLSGASSRLTVGDDECIGYSGAATFTQSAGTHTVGDATLYVGMNSTGVGIYRLTGGTLTTRFCHVGESGTGSFVNSGGTHTTQTDIGLTIAVASGSSGLYDLSSSGVLSGPGCIVGQSGSGTFSQSGGTHIVNSGYSLRLGSEASGVGIYALSGSAVLESDFETVANKGKATFTQSGGTNTVTGLNLASGANGTGTYLLSGSGVLSTQGTTVGVNGTGSFAQSGGKHSTAALALGASVSSRGSYVLSGGTLDASDLTVNANSTFDYTGGALNATSISLVDGGRMNVGAGSGRVVDTNSLSIAITAGSRLDLGDNKLVVHSTPIGSFNGSSYTGIMGWIASGRAGGDWSGSGIVTSMTAATSGNFTSIGVARASDVRPATATATALWVGQTITGTDTLVMYTYGGDANLDGKIDIDDYVKIDTGIAAGLTGWVNGDFNYDGKVNIDDYTTVIDANIGNQNGFVFATSSGIDELQSNAVAAVPEPAWITPLLTLALAWPARRRRR